MQHALLPQPGGCLRRPRHEQAVRSYCRASLARAPTLVEEAQVSLDASPAPAKTKSLRVLYLHGLESTPSSCARVALLRSAFTVSAPPLLTGRAEIGRRNSVLRCLLRLGVVRRVAAAVAAATLASALLLPSLLGAALTSLVCAALVVPPLALVVAKRKLLISLALESAVSNSLDIAAKAIAESRPDVLVGRSWGGGLASLLVAQHAWSGPVLLLAPGGATIARRLPPGSALATSLAAPLPPTAVGLVVHGESDTTCPVGDSVKLVGSAPRMRLRTVAGGHAMEGLGDGRLARFVLEAAGAGAALCE